MRPSKLLFHLPERQAPLVFIRHGRGCRMARKNKARRKQNNRVDAPKARHTLREPARDERPVQRVLVGLPKGVKRRVIELATPSTGYVDVRSSLGGSNHRDPASATAPSPSVASPRKKNVTTEKHRPQSKLSLALNPEPDVRKSSSVARERNTCKKRPDSKEAARSAGGGGGKKFIPFQRHRRGAIICEI